MRFLIKNYFFYLVALFSMSCMFSAYAANNSIYITQSGGSSALVMNIDQIGSGNVVGTTGSRMSLTGTNMTVDIDQVGDSNVIAATIAQGNTTSFTLTSTGDSNTQTLAVGATGDVAGSDFDFAATGDSNALTFTQGAAATATSGNTDIVIAGTSNDLNITSEVVGATNNWDIDGDSNDIDTTQTGNANSSIIADITGNTNNIDIDQTSSTGSTSGIVNIIGITTGGTIDIDQCSSGC
tara:strand:- start:3884 stop:4597 length:714 start_codon:yes stop_codon:yes gene_type:complete